jgi:hypothetical protein
MFRQLSTTGGEVDPVPADERASAGDAAFDGPGWDERVPDAHGRVRVRRRRRGRRLGGRLLLGGGVLAVLIVAALGWVLYTALQARTELEAVRSGVHALRVDVAAGDLAAARTDAAAIRSHADRAHELTTGPLWTGAAAVPYLGRPLATTRAVTSSVQVIAESALPALVHAADTLGSGSLRRSDGSIDVAAIAAVAPELQRASAALDEATTRIGASSADTWSGSVNAARSDLLGQLGDLSKSVTAARTAARVAPVLLGADGPRTYMVTFENEAELRGTGGLPGAFAILRADHGRLRFVRFENDNALGAADSKLHLGAAFDSLWLGHPTSAYVDSNQSPHFPYAARIWTAMWQQQSGQHLDGALALDPTTLSYLLRVTGPATLPDGTKVGSDNVVQLTQQEVYARFARNNAARKHYLLEIAQAVSHRLIGGGTGVTALLQAAGQAAAESRLLLWTRDAAAERELTAYPISGAVPLNSVPYAGVTINNGGGDKLSYYLRASFAYRRTGCGSIRDVTATLTLRNDAPRHGLPAYVTDTNSNSRPGLQRVNVSYYASAGGQVEGVTHDGRPMHAVSGQERGHTVTLFAVTLPFGTPQTFVVHLTEPAGTTAPLIRVQPMVHPMRVSVANAVCGP